MDHGRTQAYVPAVNGLLTYTGNGRGKRVLVVGSGCAGLGAAWHLNRAGWDVTLKEADSRFGGHANTIAVDGTEVDTGFMVYNALNYPNLMGLFEELGVAGLDTEMGFSVSLDDGAFEWCGDTLKGLCATRSNATNPAFYRMMRDILRFNTAALKALSVPDHHPTRTQTVGEFLRVHGFSDAFTNLYLVPMTAAIWSSSARGILDFPAITLFTFLNNHLLLQVTGHLHWKTPAKRSKEYVDKIVGELGARAQPLSPVKKVVRARDTATGAETVIATDFSGKDTAYDNVVFACHPDQALEILGDDATAEERAALGCFQYSVNDTYVHTDVALMPRSRDAWTSWNYLGTSVPATANQKPVYVTYWLNKLQKLAHPRDIFVSLNPHTPPAADKVLSRIAYSHPQYTSASVAAQKSVVALQGTKGTYFCGAWMGFGFHEDGLRSGLEVAVAICGKPLPWVQKFGQHAMIPAPTMTLSAFQSQSVLSSLFQAATKPVLWLLHKTCKYLLLTFLKAGFSRGKLTFVLEDGQRVAFVGKDVAPDEEEIVVHVFKPWFWVRVALEADLGLARSYIAGEWEVENTGPYSDGLTKVLLNLIDNMPNGKTRVKGGIDASAMASAAVGTALNWIWYKLTMDNSIANSRSNIHAHYDLSNELFQTFLDTKHMMYSSAIFQTKLVAAPTVTVGGSSLVSLEFVDSLEDAQTRKIDALLARLEPLGPEHTLLDIGFGWGGICIRAAEKYGCRVHGITLSVEQTALAQEKVREKRLEGLITFELVDYRVFAQSGRRFDRIVSCEMIEAVGHNHLHTFFRCVDQLLTTEGIFVMQAITMPDARYPVYHKSADFLNTIIFPGGCCPSLSALLTAMANESTLHLENAVNTNLHYAETLRQWRVRFNQAYPKVLALGFDDSFMRLWNLYLAMCEAGFKAQIINLQMLTFSRTGNPNLIAARGSGFAYPTAYTTDTARALVADK